MLAFGFGYFILTFLNVCCSSQALLKIIDIILCASLTFLLIFFGWSLSRFSKIFLIILFFLFSIIFLINSNWGTEDILSASLFVLFLLYIGTTPPLVFLIFAHTILEQKNWILKQKIHLCIFFYSMSIYWIFRMFQTRGELTYISLIFVFTYLLIYLLYPFIRKKLNTKTQITNSTN